MGRTAIALLVLLGLGILPVLAAEPAAPTVSITSPEPGLTLAADQVDVTAVYTAPAGAAVSKVELLVDDMVVQTADRDPAEASGALTLTWQASGYLDGKHQVVVRITDTTGATAKATITALLQRGMTVAPIRITSPLPKATVAGVVQFRLENDRSSPVKYVIFLVDNVFKAMSNLRPFVFNWDTTSYLNGLHKLQARAYLDDGMDWLTPGLEVNVDNPSGATRLQTPAPAPAVVAPVPKPKVEAAPARASQTVVPPAQHTASPTPYTAPVEVARAEIGAPGTAPYYDQAREVVTPPTTVLAERTPAGTELKVATVAEPPEPKAAPAPAADAVVSTPPPPAPTVVPAAPTPAAPVSEQAPAVPQAPEAAPAQVTPPPTPASAPARTEAPCLLPPLGAANKLDLPEGAVSSCEPIASRPVPPVMTAAAPAPTPAPVVVAEVAKPAAAYKQAKPVAPMQVALLPEPPAPVAAPSRLTAEAKPEAEGALHTVARGEYLLRIADRYGVPPYALAQANGLRPPYVLHVGQQLRLPESGIFVNGTRLPGHYPRLTLKGAAGRELRLVPLRAVVESLGGAVEWEEETQQVSAEAEGHSLIVTLGLAQAEVDGNPMLMATPAVRVQDRTLVHAAFLARALDITIDAGGAALRFAAR